MQGEIKLIRMLGLTYATNDELIPLTTAAIIL